MPESDRQSPTALDDPARLWWRADDWSLRRKLAAVVILPVIAAAIFAGLRVQDSLQEAQAASDSQARYQVLTPATTYLAAVQDFAVTLASPGAPASQVQRAHGDVDRSIKGLRSTMRSAGLTREQERTLDSAIGASPGVEARGPTTADRLRGTSTRIAQDVIRLIDQLGGTRADPALTTLKDTITAQSQLTAQKLVLGSTSSLSTSQRTQLAAATGAEIDALERVRSANIPGIDVTSIERAATRRLALAPTASLSELQSATGNVSFTYRPVSERLVSTAEGNAAREADAARWAAILGAALVLGALLITLVVALAMAQLLIRPIRTLRRRTLDIAHRRLPAAIERVQAGEEAQLSRGVAIGTREEVGQLSQAVDDMQRRAIELASEQARLRRQVTEMFETLARRNTSLVNQQLRLIERLERTEEDPARLDSLFRLDHLAARMRRNAQSLRVLAGGARTQGAEALPAGDVVRAAVSEVEDYQRVDVEDVPDVLVAENAAGDVVHLLAELVDNALSYSPPTTRVQISGARSIAGGVLLEVSDQGLGIEEAEVERHNDELDTGGVLSVDTARHMGLYVVARLSQKHGVSVRLRQDTGGGTVTAVQLPTDILSTRPAQPVATPSTDRPLAAKAQAAPALPGPTAGSDSPGEAALVAAAMSENGLPRRRPGATGINGRTSLEALALTPRPVSGSEQKSEAESEAESAVTPRDASSFFAAREQVRAQRAEPDTEQRAEPDTEQAAPEATPARTNGARTAEPIALGDTPIFGSLRSQWLSADDEPLLPWVSDETDRAWQSAKVATEDVTASGSTENGLPRRRPGAFVVPGSIDTGDAGSAPLRDPVALRDSLSRYATGVARGREASLVPGSDDEEEQP